ncbi:MAG: T9SS type A sorting domain-containing protein [Fervidobacterium sp.]
MRVTLKVFDVLGREVATLVDGEMDSGKHSVVFNAKDLPSGVYFYTLKTSKFVKTRKMMLLR